MHKQLLLVVLSCAISTVALAEDDFGLALAKWKSCVDETAIRYSRSKESALVVARLAAFSCAADKDLTWQEAKKREGGSFADKFVETAEREYLDHVAVNVIELRIR